MPMALNSKHTLCSAQRLAERYYNFEPTWIEENFQKDFPKKPSMIFIDSMSDICWWEQEWVDRVVQRIFDEYNHTFIVLTKRPDLAGNLLEQSYLNLCGNGCNPNNLWLGVSVSTQADADLKIPQLLQIHTAKHFVSIEPIQEEIDLFPFIGYKREKIDGDGVKRTISTIRGGVSDNIGNSTEKISLIIVGQESGNRKGKIIANIDWMLSILHQCRSADVPIFFKDNLKSVWGGNVIQEWPEL
jgi:protein gp37